MKSICPRNGSGAMRNTGLMLSLSEAARRPVGEVGEETAQLAAAGGRGLVLLPRFEEEYYLGVNLPEQLGRLFAPLNPRRVDEDLLEDLCASAQALVRTSALSDDAVQLFYRALAREGLNEGAATVRRPGETQAERAAPLRPPGTAALHALKRLWASDWAFGAVLARLDESGGIGLDARPTLVLPG